MNGKHEYDLYAGALSLNLYLGIHNWLATNMTPWWNNEWKRLWSYLIVEDWRNQLCEGGGCGGVAEGGSEEQGGGAVVNHLSDQAEAGPPDPSHNGAQVAAAEYWQQASDKNTPLFKYVPFQ